jgi:hypothetical protein
VIPGNDDAIRSGSLMCRVLADAVVEGRFIAEHRRKNAPPPAEEAASGPSPRPRRVPAPPAAAPAAEAPVAEAPAPAPAPIAEAPAEAPPADAPPADAQLAEVATGAPEV